MKITTLALPLFLGAALTVGSACSSKRTVTETRTETAPSTIADQPEQTDVTLTPPASASAPATASGTTGATTEDAGLGASSSGRSR